MAKFRKKPVDIEAIQFTDETKDRCSVFVTCNTAAEFEDGAPVLRIQTLEGVMTARFGDWIIKGVKGEFYPCKPDIFAATYEPCGPLIEGEPLAGPGVGVPADFLAICQEMLWERGNDVNYATTTAKFKSAIESVRAIEAAERAAPAAIGEGSGPAGSQAGPVGGDSVEVGASKRGKYTASALSCADGHLAANIRHRLLDIATVIAQKRGAETPGGEKTVVDVCDVQEAVPEFLRRLLPRPVAPPPQPLVLPSREELAKVMYEAASDGKLSWKNLSASVVFEWQKIADAVIARIAERGGERKEQPIVYYGVPVQVCEAAHAELESATSIEAIRARVLLKSAIDTAARRKDRDEPQPIVYGVPWEACEALEAYCRTWNDRCKDQKDEQPFGPHLTMGQMRAFLSAYEAARRNATENPLAGAYKSACEQRDAAQRKLAEFEEKDWVQTAADEQRRADAAEEQASAMEQQLSEARAAKEAAEATCAAFKEWHSQLLAKADALDAQGYTNTPRKMQELAKDVERFIDGTAGQSLLSELTSLRAKLAEAERENKGYRRRHDWDLVKQDIEELSSLKARAAQLAAVLRVVQYREIKTKLSGVADRCVYCGTQKGSPCPESCELAAALGGSGSKNESG